MSKEIPLTQGKVAIVDDEDFEWLSKYKWFFNGRYAVRNSYQGKREYIRMHRVIMQTPEGMDTDHINGNGLDNRRVNLRICTRSENNCNRVRHKNNTSGLKGVYLDKKAKKWRAHIRVGGKGRSLGSFSDAKLAHEFYCLAADMLHGEYANHG